MALAFQSNAAFTRALVRPTPPIVVREKDPSSLATPEPTPARLPELSPLCIPAVPTALSLPADTPSTTAVASPKSDSSHISKEPSSGSQEDGELEDSESSDVEIFLSSLGLENAVPSTHTSTAPDSEHVPEDVHVSPTVSQQQKPANVSDDILSPQLPPAPLQQTIPLPDVTSDSEAPGHPTKPTPSQPVVVPKETTQHSRIAEESVAARLTPSNSRDIYLDDCINIDSSHKTPNVYINGLPPHFPEEQLYALAAPFGAIRSVRTFTRHVKESESGYGFVLFETVEAAEKCIISLRRYRNLHPTFSKQVHKIPGIAYTQLPPPQDLPSSDSALSPKWGQKGSEDEMSFKEKMESLHDPTTKLTPGNRLPLSIDEATLAALVSPHRISSSRFFQTRLSNPPRIIAFVRLETRIGAEEIVERLHGRMVRGWNDSGSRISVRFADTAEQRELRRSERVNKEGEQSPGRLTIAQAALLNMRGQELRQRPMIPAHQSLPDRLDRLRVDPYLDFPNNHLPPTGLTVDYSLTPSASYVSPRLQTSISTSYMSSQQRDPVSPNVDPAMLTLLDSLRGSRSFHNGDYASHDNDIQYNIRPQIPSRTPHVLDDFGYAAPQYPLRNGYTPTEEYIMRAHAESTALRQGRRPPPIDLYRRRSDSDAAASITVGVRGQRAQASTITIPQQKIFPHPNVTEVHNVAEDDFQSSAALAPEFRPRTQQPEARQDNIIRHKLTSHVSARLSREPVHSKSQQAPPAIQQSLQNEQQYPAGHTRCSTLPHRSSSTAQHQRHYQHNSMSVPSTTHAQDAISAILSSMNSSNALANSKSKPSNNETTTDHVTNDRNESSQFKIGNRLSFDNVKGATQFEKHNARLIRDPSLNNEVEQSSSSLTSPALTYSSQTPSTLSPATPFFGSFASQSDGFEQQGPHGTNANKLKMN
ncbi:hypothetical protein F5887DRAFT_1236013 [Amanita rubescens]|nr:hypothetical protein F5887DRAFT_1236013 [Amanita rubescens]